MKTDNADLSGTGTSQGPTGNLLPTSSQKYTPNPAFIPQDRAKPWYTTASDQVTDMDIMIISEWLRSGGAYTQYTDPAHWVKLLLDQENA